jgi:hypothetical protein
VKRAVAGGYSFWNRSPKSGGPGRLVVVVVVALLSVIGSLGVASPSLARGRGQARLENNGPSTKIEDTDDELISGVVVGGGHPYQVMCASRQPPTRTSEPENEFGEVVVEYYDDETKSIQKSTVTKLKRQYVVVTLTCGGKVLKTSRICVPNVGFDPCIPEDFNISGKEVAEVTPVGFPNVTASMAPYVRGRGRYDFALTQAPFSFGSRARTLTV